MENWINRFIESVLTPNRRQPVSSLLLGVYLFAISTTALADLIINDLGKRIQQDLGIDLIHYKIGLFISLGLLVFVLLITRWFVRFSGRGNIRQAIQIKPPVALTGTSIGLIVTMSLRGKGEWNTVPAYNAIKHHWNNGSGLLTYCWIICFGEATQSEAKVMIEGLIDAELKLYKNGFIVSDPRDPNRTLQVWLRYVDVKYKDNPNKMFECVSEIYDSVEEIGLEPGDIIADYQGGTKSMTAGMVLACAVPERKLEFMCPQQFTKEGRADTEYEKPGNKEPIATYVPTAYKVRPARISVVDRS